MKNFQINTFSIIGYDPKTKGFWIAVASKWLAVGSIVPFIKPGVGAIATQALTNISFGSIWLTKLESGKWAHEVLDELLKSDSNLEARQIAIMDKNGNWVVHTGNKCTKWAGWIVSDNCVIQGNMLDWENTIIAISEAFQKTDWTLAERLYAALLAWDKEWWDKRGKQSSALFVIDTPNEQIEVNGKIIDLRVDDSENPIKDLWKLLEKHIYLYK
jgi:uncharacterized Ntn-hydrolase superfamily protein